MKKIDEMQPLSKKRRGAKYELPQGLLDYVKANPPKKNERTDYLRAWAVRQK